MIDLDEIKRTLERIVGHEFLFTSEKPEYYAYLFGDATMYRSKPEYVVYPGSVEEIQAIIKFASNRKLKVIPGAGLTGLSGGAVCDGGILLNPSRLRSIKNVDTISRTVIVEPGISCAQLNSHLAEYGMIVPVAPASHEISTLGANIASASGGTWGMSKGTFKNYLLSLKVVDGTGDLIELGKACPKQSTGPDLTSLFLGSEGTMGVIIEITLRCDLLPEDIWTVRVSFKDESVLQAIHEGIAKHKIQLFSFEYMDDKIMRCMGKRNMLLLLQTAGTKDDAKEQAEQVVAILKSMNPIELKYTNNQAEADKLYAERRSALGALAKADRGKPVIVQFDPVLPLLKLTEGIKKMRELAQKEGLELIIYGHAGDGNLHPSFIVADDFNEKIKTKTVIREFDAWVEEQGGCYSGEHAVGFFLGRDQGEMRGISQYLRKIKSAFDPNGIMNPGKVVDVAEPSIKLDPVMDTYEEIAQLCILCSKCHLCKNDSPEFKEIPMEHNTIRGRISMIDSATRGKIPFAAIKPFIQQMRPWTTSMNCPTYIKEEMPKLLDLTLAS
ncbi:MAG: FAD-binding oxidoreductase [Candidatus Bathyarchaeota archaeon]|nr:FAD-binding oxidoreductase [Candidatus Bathyarchaeota archaeon]